MKKILLILSILFVSMECFAQFHVEDGVVYCDLEYLIIGRIQANYFDDMAVCQHPSGYAFMLLEGDRVLATVDIGKTKEEAIDGMKKLTELLTQDVSKRKEFNLKDMHGKEVRVTVYPGVNNDLKTKARMFSPSSNLGGGIMLTNNLNYFSKILVKYPTVQFK